MVRFLSLGVLLILPIVMTGSSLSAPATPQINAALVEARQVREAAVAAVRQSPLLREAVVSIPDHIGSSSAMDTCLTVLMAGGLIAWQLRRAQRSARIARVAI